MTAILSPCGRYRYRLERDLAGGRGACAFIMLNPSTADATTDDSTIRRCIGYARTWGYAKLIVGNAYAWRSTDPDELWTTADPFGPANDDHLASIIADAELLVCGWGTDAKPEHGLRVRDLIVKAGKVPHALKLNKDGSPGHPLYLRRNLTPFPWSSP